MLLNKEADRTFHNHLNVQYCFTFLDTEDISHLLSISYNNSN